MLTYCYSVKPRIQHCESEKTKVQVTNEKKETNPQIANESAIGRQFVLFKVFLVLKMQ